MTMTYETEGFDDIEALMQEPSGGFNHGSLNGVSLDTNQAQTDDYLRGKGWSVVFPYKDGLKGNPGGGTLHPDEYVDTDLLRARALEEFGYTADQIAAVYSRPGGAIKHELSQLRAEMDARMLALRDSGANMFQFAEAIGLNQRTMNRAVDRAVAARS